MNFLDQWNLFFTPYLSFAWQDIAEISFFSYLFYLLLRWLSTDTTKNLLPYLYSYLLILASAHVGELTSIKYFLILFFPGLCYLFALIHEKTLQRNLLALTSAPAKQQITPINLINMIMSAALKAARHNHHIICLLEYRDNMHSFIHPSDNVMDSNINLPLLELIFTHAERNNNAMVWLHSTGVIRGINALWSDTHHDFILAPHQAIFEKAKKYTAHTDAILFSMVSDPSGTIVCNMVASGTLVKTLSVDCLALYLKKQFVSTIKLNKLKKESQHAAPITQTTAAQRQP